jgi:UDP-GlcNAc:undecaprenyl-phosphate GlcNAc-1-phosphate transferase
MIPISSFLTALIVSVISICMYIPLARRIGLLDCPGGRKCHDGAVPLVGGVAMFTGFLFAILSLPTSLDDYRSFIASMALLVVVGLMDDLRELSARARFIAQIVAGLLMTLWGGVVLNDLGDLLMPVNLELGAWALPFTVFSVVGVINALNMSDGIDGLAGGVVMISLIFLSVMALAAGNFGDTSVIVVLLASVIAFLFFNFPIPGRKQAKVFMGDSGSMFLGFALAWFSVSLTQGSDRAMAPITALWIVGLPMMDTVAVMLRRIIRGRSPFAPDREHFHHIMLVAGYSTRTTVVTMMLVASVFSIIGIAGESFGIPEYVMFYCYLVVFSLYFLGMMHAWKVMKIIKAH